MEILTFESELSEQDKNYPEYKYGKIIIHNNKPLFQVYNEINIKEVTAFNIKLTKPFDKDYRYGRIIYNNGLDRVYILLINKNNRKNIQLSRYIYQVHNNIILEELHVDHNNGNRLDDRIENLSCLTELHNYQKSLYGRYWLPKYNKEHNTNYTEQDMLDITLLNEVMNYAETIRPNEIKKSKSEYRKIYNLENKDNISKYNKEYGKTHYKENKNFVNKRKWLSEKLNILLKKQWTIEIGNKILTTIDEIFQLYNVTLEEISKGLDITKYQIKTITMLNKLVLIFSENTNKINDNV